MNVSNVIVKAGRAEGRQAPKDFVVSALNGDCPMIPAERVAAAA